MSSEGLPEIESLKCLVDIQRSPPPPPKKNQQSLSKLIINRPSSMMSFNCKIISISIPSDLKFLKSIYEGSTLNKDYHLQYQVYHCIKYGRIRFFTDSYLDSVLLRENAGQWKPVFSHILCSVCLEADSSSLNSKILWKNYLTKFLKNIFERDHFNEVADQQLQELTNWRTC